MAPMQWTAEIFTVNSDGIQTKKVDRTVIVKLEYDPQGLNLKVLDGKHPNPTDLFLFICDSLLLFGRVFSCVFAEHNNLACGFPKDRLHLLIK